jgi:hypothetical protein
MQSAEWEFSKEIAILDDVKDVNMWIENGLIEE